MKRMGVNPLVLRALEVVERKVGLHELALRLHMPEDTVRAWRDGNATMPERYFLRLVDVLTEISADWQDWDDDQ